MAKYEYGTSPKKINPKQKPKPKKTETNKKGDVGAAAHSRPNKKQKPQKKKTSKLKVTIYIIIGFAITFAISYRNSTINENFNKVQTLKKDLSILEQESDQLKVNIESNLNLKQLEQLAKEQLGMQKLQDTQKIYITLPKKDYVEPASEEVKIQEEKNIFQIIVDLLNGI